MMEWVGSLFNWYGVFFVLSWLTLLSKRRIVRWGGGLLLGFVAITALLVWAWGLPHILGAVYADARQQAEQSLVNSLLPIINDLRSFARLRPLPLQVISDPDYTSMIVTVPLKVAIIATAGFLLRLLIEIFWELHYQGYWDFLMKPAQKVKR